MGKVFRGMIMLVLCAGAGGWLPGCGRNGPPIPSAEVEIDSGLAHLESYGAQLEIDFAYPRFHARNGYVWIILSNQIERANAAYYENTLILTDWAEPEGGTFYQIGETRYTIGSFDYSGILLPTCLIEASSPDPKERLSSTARYLSAIRYGALIAKGEVVSGIKTNRYRVTGADFSMVENEKVSGEVWIAQEGGYMVKGSGRITGNLTMGERKRGRADWKYELVNANRTVVRLPPECRNQTDQKADWGNPPDDIPVVYPMLFEECTHASDVFACSTRMNYYQVVDFYRAQMKSNGWVLARETTGNAHTSLTYQKAARTVQIEISPPDATRPTWLEVYWNESGGK